jgi:hypothetical protein
VFYKIDKLPTVSPPGPLLFWHWCGSQSDYRYVLFGPLNWLSNPRRFAELGNGLGGSCTKVRRVREEALLLFFPTAIHGALAYLGRKYLHLSLTLGKLVLRRDVTVLLPRFISNLCHGVSTVICTTCVL